MFHDYTTIASESRYKGMKGELIKTLSYEQILQRLLTVLAKVEEGNISEYLVKEMEKLSVISIEQRKSLKKYRAIWKIQYRYNLTWI